MNRTDITTTLKGLIRQQEQVTNDLVSITEETKIDQIGFDSISILDFMYDLEDKLGVRIEIADLVNMEKVKDLIDYLDGKLAG